MPKRVDLPGASELFRPTSDKPGRRTPAPAPEPGDDSTPQATGRIKHEEKITVYFSSEELLALEQLRLTLRGRHGVTADRGRIVRAAIAEVLADVAEHGSDARVIKRLTAS